MGAGGDWQTPGRVVSAEAIGQALPWPCPASPRVDTEVKAIPPALGWSLLRVGFLRGPCWRAGSEPAPSGK